MQLVYNKVYCNITIKYKLIYLLNELSSTHYATREVITFAD